MINKTSLLLLLGLAISPTPPLLSSEQDDIRRILAIQAAEIQKLKEELKYATKAISSAQSTADTAKTLAASKLDLTNACIISPDWLRCPDGFTDHGNFYACFPQGSGLGSDATGMVCGGPYDDRHVTVCCRR